MNPHSAAVAGSGNPWKSRFESEIRAKIFSKSADPFAYSPPSLSYWRPLVLVQLGFEPATSRSEDWRLSIELTGRRFLDFIVGCFVIRALQLSAKMISTRIIKDCTKPRHSLGKPRASETSRKWTSFLFYLQNTPRIPRGGGEGVLLIMAYIWGGLRNCTVVSFRYMKSEKPGDSRSEVNERIGKSVLEYFKGLLVKLFRNDKAFGSLRCCRPARTRLNRRFSASATQARHLASYMHGFNIP